MTSPVDVPSFAKIGLVVIGRNEGERLARCLASVRAIPHGVYVDSGSTDGSVELARKEGRRVNGASKFHGGTRAQCGTCAFVGRQSGSGVRSVD